MEEYSNNIAGFNQDRELANDPGFYAWRGAENFKVQQQFESNNNLPYQQDYQSYQPPFYSQPQPKPHSTFHSSSFQDPHYNSQSYFPENDQVFFQNPNSTPNFQTSAYGNEDPYFQSQQSIFYPQPHAPEQCHDFQEQEHGYYSQPYALMEFQQENHQFPDHQQWSYDPQPSLMSEEAFAAIMEALRPSPQSFSKQEVEVEESNFFSHGAGSPGNSQDAVIESNREEEEYGIAVVDKAWNLSSEVEVQGIGTREEKFRERDDKESSPCVFLHTEQDKSLLCLPLQNELGMTSRAEQEASLRNEYARGEAESDHHLTAHRLQQQGEKEEEEKEEAEQGKSELESPQETAINHSSAGISSARDIYVKQQQQEKEEEKKKLDVVHSTLLEGKEGATIDALAWEDLDILMQDEQNLWQHGSSIQGKGEEEGNLQISPPLLQLLRFKGTSVEDFPSSELDFPLHDESSINDGQHPTKGEKQREGRRITPDLLKYEASELHPPQATTPRRKEAAVYPSKFNNFSFEFELTSNEFSFSLSMFISGVKLQTQQLLRNHFCKLQPKVLLGEVHKQGAHGDGVPWFIKVHPP